MTKICFCIYLLQNYNAKLSGFGLAMLGPSDGELYVETQVMGTYGYAAPEYVATGSETYLGHKTGQHWEGLYMKHAFVGYYKLFLLVN